MTPLEKLRELLDMKPPYCGDNSCAFAGTDQKRGQHTNGGCRCLDSQTRASFTYFRKLHFYRNSLPDLLAVIDAAKKSLIEIKSCEGCYLGHDALRAALEKLGELEKI